MRVGKQHTTARKSVKIRGLGLRMPAHATDPVVQVIYRNEQDVGFGRPRIRSIQQNKQQDNGALHADIKRN